MGWFGKLTFGTPGSFSAAAGAIAARPRHHLVDKDEDQVYEGDIRQVEQHRQLILSVCFNTRQAGKV